MGAILRTAEAFGVSNIVLSEPVLDFFNPNVVRSSRGLMARLQVSAGTKEEVNAWLEEAGLRIVGTSSKSSKPYWDLQLSKGLLLFWEANEKAWVNSRKERIGEWARSRWRGSQLVEPQRKRRLFARRIQSDGRLKFRACEAREGFFQALFHVCNRLVSQVRFRGLR